MSSLYLSDELLKQFMDSSSVLFGYSLPACSGEYLLDFIVKRLLRKLLVWEQVFGNRRFVYVRVRQELFNIYFIVSHRAYIICLF